MLGRGTDREGIGALLGRLAEDTRGLARAEIDLAKARVGERVSSYKDATIFFVAAGVLALAGLIALLVGLIMSLATLIGPGFATAAVVLAVFALAGVLAMIGKGKLAKPRQETVR